MPYKRNYPAQLYFYARDNVTGQPTVGRTLSASRILSAQSASAVDGTLVSVGGGMWRFSANSADMNAEHVGMAFTEQSTVPVMLNVRTQVSGDMMSYAGTQTACVSALASRSTVEMDDLRDFSADMFTLINGVSAAVAAVSAIILTSAEHSAIMAQALTDYDGPTAGEITTLSANLNTNIGGVSAAVAAVSALILTSAEHSAIAAQAVADGGGGGLTSAGASSVMQTVLTNYDVPTSADISAIVETRGAQVSSGINGHLEIMSAALTNISAAMLTSAETSAIVNTALTQYDVATSADVSAILAAGGGGGGLTSAGASSVMQTVLTNYEVPSSAAVSAIVEAIAGGGVGLTSAQASTIMAQALTDYDAPTAAEITTLSANLNTNIGGVSAAVAAVSALILTSAEQSAIAAQAVSDGLTAYDAPTSADVSAIVAAGGGGLTSAGASSVMQTVLTNYQVPSSAAVSAIVEAVAGGGVGLTSAQASTIMEGVLPVAFKNLYRNTETGTAVSATASGIQLRASAASAATYIRQFVYVYDTSGSSEVEKYATGKGQMRFITSYGTADKWAGLNRDWDITPQAAKYIIIPAEAVSADVTGLGSAETSAIMQASLVNFGVATSAVVSGAAKQAISDASLATSANLANVSAAVTGVSAAISARVASAISNAALATSAQVATVSAALSTHAAQALSDYDALTSADLPIKANVVQLGDSSADLLVLTNTLDLVLETSASGTPTTTVIPTQLTAAQMPDDDWLIGRIVTFRGGAMDGQQVEITGATSAGNLTVTTCTRAPLSGQAMVIT